MSQQPPLPPSEQPLTQLGQSYNVQVPTPQKKSRTPKLLGIGCGGLLLALALCGIISIATKGT